jgi:hypothetical protein
MSICLVEDALFHANLQTQYNTTRHNTKVQRTQHNTHSTIQHTTKHTHITQQTHTTTLTVPFRKLLCEIA